MIHRDDTHKATCEDISYNRFDSLPALHISPLNDDGDVDSPSSHYSSCGESDFERYCSANSVLGTPSVCSTITVFNDFTDNDKSDVESVSLRDGVDIRSKDQRLSSSGSSKRSPFSRTGIRSNDVRTHQNLKFCSIGLELYGDDNEDVPGVTMLGASGSQMVPFSNGGMRKALGSSSNSPNLWKNRHVLSKVSDYFCLICKVKRS